MSERRSHLVVVFWSLLAIVGIGQSAHRLIDHVHPPHPAATELATHQDGGHHHDHADPCCGHNHSHTEQEDHGHDHESPCDDPESPCDHHDHSDCELCLSLGSLVSPVPTSIGIVAIDKTTFEYLNEDRSVSIIRRRIASAPTRGPPPHPISA